MIYINSRYIWREEQIHSDRGGEIGGSDKGEEEIQ